MKGTHWSNIVEKIGNVINDPIDVFVLLQESMPFAVCHLANDIECVELQPSREITAISC